MNKQAFPDPDIAPEEQPSLSVSVVSDKTSFDALEPAWQQLWSEAQTATPFNSFIWDSTWWSVFSASMDTLQILTIRAGNKLVALLPMYVRSVSGQRFGTLRFIGTGESQRHEVATEYSDLLVMPGFEDKILPEVAQWLLSFKRWSRIDLRCMLQSALILHALDSARTALHRFESPTGKRYRVPLDNNAAVVDLMGGTNQKRIRRSLKALDRDGGFVRTCLSKDTGGGDPLAELVALNRQRQDVKQRRSAFNSRRFQRFHKAVFDRMSAEGMAAIQGFYLQDSLLACIYCFYDSRCAYYYQSGFACENANKYMPLTAAHLQEASAARKSGLHYYDLMRAETPTYKEAMATDTEPLLNVYLFKSGLALRRYRLVRRSRKLLVQQLNKIGIQRHRRLRAKRPSVMKG